MSQTSVLETILLGKTNILKLYDQAIKDINNVGHKSLGENCKFQLYETTEMELEECIQVLDNYVTSQT